MRTNMWLLLMFITTIAISVVMLGVQMVKLNTKIDKCGCSIQK